MEKVPIEILGLSPSQSQGATSFAIILGEVGGNRRLPIIIGMFEAQAIAIEIEKIRPNRPMTHDLFKSFAEKCNLSITEMIISDLREGVFFAKIVGNQQDTNVSIDARPSDAIAIALRFGVAMYAYSNVLDEAGIVLEEIDESQSQEQAPKTKKTEEELVPFKERIKRMSTKQLKELLQEAIEKEEYEQAVSIRDEISKRN